MKKLILFISFIFLFSASAFAGIQVGTGAGWSEVSAMDIGSGSGWQTIVGKYYDGSEWFVLAGVLTESHVELFLDETNIESYSGVSFSVNKPTKQTVSNGYANFNDTWDVGGGCWVPNIRYDESQSQYPWRMHYSTLDTTLEKRECGFAYSSNLTSWTKPTLSVYQNNQYLAGYISHTRVKSFPNNTGNEYILVGRHKDSGSPYIYTSKADNDLVLFSSSTETGDWSYLTDAVTITEHGEYLEGNDLCKRTSDNKWLLYYTDGHGTDDREVGVYLSDTTSLVGSWTDQGIIISAPSTDQQKYWIKIFQDAGYYIGVVPEYDEPSDDVDDNELYVSRDGISWTLKDSAWFGCGEVDSWDDELVEVVSFVELDNNFYVFYRGKSIGHDTVGVSQLGWCTIGKRRIGQVLSTGNITTTEITATDELIVNCNSSTGQIKVELLDPTNNSVLSGYSQADCQAISANSYNKPILWGGKSLPNQNVKIKFYLSGAILYSFYTGDY